MVLSEIKGKTEDTAEYVFYCATNGKTYFYDRKIPAGARRVPNQYYNSLPVPVRKWLKCVFYDRHIDNYADQVEKYAREQEQFYKDTIDLLQRIYGRT